MKKIAIAVAVIVSLFGCGGGGGGSGTTPPPTPAPTNIDPVISTLDAALAEAFNGESISLTANATDGDTNDILTYDFNTNIADITETTNTDSTSSVICEEGLTTINVTVSDGNGGSVSSSRAITCNLTTIEVKDKLIDNLGLTSVVDGGTVDGMDIDFSGTATDGTILGFVYNSAQDFSNHNDISARGTSGSPQRVMSINAEADSSSLPTTFDIAQDLLVLAISANSKASNPALMKVGTGDSDDICVTIRADETYNNGLENISQTGSYTFEGRDIASSTSTLSFEDGLYLFPIAADGNVDLSALAGEVYESVGPGVEELLNGSESNSDSIVNVVCDTSVLINPFSNTNPIVAINSVTYSSMLADGTTPRDIGTVIISYTSNDVDEGTTNLATTGTVSSSVSGASVDFTLNSNGDLEAELLTLAGATDAVINLTITDTYGGNGTDSSIVGVVDLNDAPACTSVQTIQYFSQGEGAGSVTLIDPLNCTDPEGDAGTIIDYVLDTNTLGSYSQTVTVEDEHGASFEYVIDGEIVLGNVDPLCLNLQGAQLYAQDGLSSIPNTYLGTITNKFETDSIFNEFGLFGSPFGLDSIWNEFGLFGSTFGLHSAFNSFSSSAPMMIKNNVIIGYITTNVFFHPGYSISPNDLKTQCGDNL
jgi:hypothetical protein